MDMAWGFLASIGAEPHFVLACRNIASLLFGVVAPFEDIDASFYKKNQAAGICQAREKRSFIYPTTNR